MFLSHTHLPHSVLQGTVTYTQFFRVHLVISTFSSPHSVVQCITTHPPHQPCQCYKYTTSVDFFFFLNAIQKASHSCRIICECSESAREWRTVLYKSNQQLSVLGYIQLHTRHTQYVRVQLHTLGSFRVQDQNTQKIKKNTSSNQTVQNMRKLVHALYSLITLASILSF